MVNVKKYKKINLNKSVLIIRCDGQPLKTTDYCLLLLNNNQKDVIFFFLDTTVRSDMYVLLTSGLAQCILWLRNCCSPPGQRKDKEVKEFLQEDYNDTTENVEQNGYSYKFKNTHAQDQMSLIAKITGRLTKEVMVVVLGEFFHQINIRFSLVTQLALVKLER